MLHQNLESNVCLGSAVDLPNDGHRLSWQSLCCFLARQILEIGSQLCVEAHFSCILPCAFTCGSTGRNCLLIHWPHTGKHWFFNSWTRVHLCLQENFEDQFIAGLTSNMLQPFLGTRTLWEVHNPHPDVCTIGQLPTLAPSALSDKQGFWTKLVTDLRTKFLSHRIRYTCFSLKYEYEDLEKLKSLQKLTLAGLSSKQAKLRIKKLRLITVTVGICVMVTLFTHVVPGVYHYLLMPYFKISPFQSQQMIIYRLVELNSFLNLFIYVIRQKEIRSGLLSLLTCKQYSASVKSTVFVVGAAQKLNPAIKFNSVVPALVTEPNPRAPSGSLNTYCLPKVGWTPNSQEHK